MTAIMLAVSGTLFSVILLADWKLTGGRNVAELLRVERGIFQKGAAKTRNALILLGLVGPLIGVFLLLGVDEEAAMMWSFLGVFSLGAVAAIGLLTWVVVSEGIRWLRRR